MRSIRIGVQELVSFLYASGDLSSETFQNVSLLEGTRAHQRVQQHYQPEDQKEVHIAYEFDDHDRRIILNGRIDGLLVRDGKTIIEEIKSTRSMVLEKDFAYKKEHLAQLRMYAYMYMVRNDLSKVDGRLNYVRIADDKQRHESFSFLIHELRDFFFDSIMDYLEWYDILYLQQKKKFASIDGLEFPYSDYRRGQREMMAATYQAMTENDVQYVIAPTGIGKTMATLFASIKALKDERQKIFYATAKTVGKRIALESVTTLQARGLDLRILEITARDTTCFLEKRDCNPDVCPYAKGFFDRLQEATKDIITTENRLDRKTVESYAKTHRICPFEYSLYVSYFVDVIVSDYNYVFDPRAHLVRYFDEEGYRPLLLVDEAHNMIARSREMYSATLSCADFRRVRRLSSQLKPSIRYAVEKVLDRMDAIKEEIRSTLFKTEKRLDPILLETITNVLKKIENTLKENPKAKRRTDILEVYLLILAFTRIHDFYNENYLTNYRLADETLHVTIRCLDASPFILRTLLEKSYGAVFFSATMHPIEYYKTLLTRGYGNTLKIRSPFDPGQLKLAIMNRISTRYADRGRSLSDVIATIRTVIEAKSGNYIAFFPSYAYLNQVYQGLVGITVAELIVQKPSMESLLRDETIERFKRADGRTRIALFVMGGIFSEGIDYIGDMLSGVIVVGVGLPMISVENDQLLEYYERTFRHGFDYAYTYPGMNRVIQAVGRVIRTSTDRGVAVLIDDR
ncbi:MAG: helicase C-terminal domain-containing protein, partial [Acholeplasmataceae bacterium]